MAAGRTLRKFAVGATLLGGVASLAVLYVLRRPVPRSKGKLRLGGLRDTVEVIRDRGGVPHIYAQNLHDVFFAVGYAQAQDRLFQMDFSRRLASGRLAEVAGEPALEIDRLLRRVGFHRVAETDWRDAPDRSRVVLEAYSAGVNAYMEGCRAPLEFSVLRYRPEPWRPQDTLMIGRLIGWSLSGNWDAEIIKSWTVERFGAALTAELDSGYPEGHPLVVPPGTEARSVSADYVGDYEGTLETVSIGGGMSNNWAVDGEKSVTGKPLLASDPHLTLGIPAIWWEVHVDSPELKAAGVGMPGMPGIFMGHNDRIAWGMTASMSDQDDMFVEQVNPDNPGQYRYQGEWVDGEVVREEIKVRGRSEPDVEEVLVTRHGPVISPAIKGETRTLAMKSVTLEPSQQIEASLLLMGARDWGEFREALSTWPMPPLNFGYADVEGNIGYQLAGFMPVRAKGHGVVPSPGWTGDHEWIGWVPFDELPNAYNPPTHWVASANNKIVDDDYPHFLSANYSDGYRQKRIIEMLESKDKHSVEDFKAMQADQLSLSAKELVPQILQLKPRDEYGRRALNFLKGWDYRLSADSVAAGVYEVYYTTLVRRALEEKLGDWAEFFMGKGVHPVRRNGIFFGGAHGWLLEKMRERPAWFEGKTWHEVMEECLVTATTELRKRLGNEASRWQWGRLHKQWFKHALGEVRGLDLLFNRGPVPVGGDANTVWQASFAPYHGFEANSFAPSWRQVIDLADFNRSAGTLPTGQSGHAGSRHYADMIEGWRTGQYHPMPWDRDEVEKVAAGRLELSPN